MKSNTILVIATVAVVIGAVVLFSFTGVKTLDEKKKKLIKSVFDSDKTNFERMRTEVIALAPSGFVRQTLENQIPHFPAKLSHYENYFMNHPNEPVIGLVPYVQPTVHTQSLNFVKVIENIGRLIGGDVTVIIDTTNQNNFAY